MKFFGCLALALVLSAAYVQGLEECTFTGSDSYCAKQEGHVCCRLFKESAIAWDLKPASFYCISSDFFTECEDFKFAPEVRVENTLPAAASDDQDEEAAKDGFNPQGFAYRNRHNSCYFDSSLFSMFACSNDYSAELSRKHATHGDGDKLAVLQNLVNHGRTNKVADDKDRDSFRSLLASEGAISAYDQEDVRQLVELVLNTFSDQYMTVYETGRCVFYNGEKFCTPQRPLPADTSKVTTDVWRVLTALACDQSNSKEFVLENKDCEFQNFEDRIQTASGGIDEYRIDPESAELYLNSEGKSLADAAKDDKDVPRKGDDLVMTMYRDYRFISTLLPTILPVHIQRQISYTAETADEITTVKSKYMKVLKTISSSPLPKGELKRLTIGRKYNNAVGLPDTIDLSSVTNVPGGEGKASARYRLLSVVLHEGDWMMRAAQPKSGMVDKTERNYGHYTAATKGCGGESWTFYNDMSSKLQESAEFLDRWDEEVAFAFYVREDDAFFASGASGSSGASGATGAEEEEEELIGASGAEDLEAEENSEDKF